MAIAGSASMLFFTYFHPHGRVLWLPFRWNLLFIGINACFICKSIYERNILAVHGVPNDLLDVRENLKASLLRVVDPVDWYNLVSLGEEEICEDGTVVVRQDEMNPYVRMVITGQLDIVRDNVRTYTVKRGSFASESGLHAGLLLEGDVRSTCDIVARGKGEKQVRILKWDRTKLTLLLQNNGNLHRSLKAALTWNVVRKLKSQRHELNRRYPINWGGEKLDDDDNDDDDNNDDEGNKDDEDEI